jgi:osmotically-inducible protein OsmY
VNVTDGVVILSGEAANAAQKELTAEYARDVEVVTDVKKEMTIAGSTKEPDHTAGEKIDDASITAQVKATLLAHPSTCELKTKVAPLDGVVTVSGVA